jgi:hypothetical protein
MWLKCKALSLNPSPTKKKKNYSKLLPRGQRKRRNDDHSREIKG